MKKNLVAIESPLKMFLWALGVLLFLFLLLEAWRYSSKPTLANNSAALHQSLNTATKLFYQHQRAFLEQSKELSLILENQIRRGRSLQELYASLQDYSTFWGVTLMRGGEPIVWNGFSMTSLPSEPAPPADSAAVKIMKQNNVLYWLCDISFTVGNSGGQRPTYQLYTSRLIEQNNALPIKSEGEYYLMDQISEDLSYPVELSVFNPLPKDGSVYTVIKNSRQDSIGIFYASPSEFDVALERWELNTWFWRSLFLIVCFVTLSLLSYLWIDRLPNLQGLFYQLLIVAIGWTVFHVLDIPERWVPEFMNESARQEFIRANQILTGYIANSIFAFLAAFTLTRKTGREAIFIRSRWYPFRIFVAALVGLINVGVILLVISYSYTLAVTSEMSLLGLRLLPPTETLLFYLGSGLLIYSAGLGLVSLNRLILRSGVDQHKPISIIVLISFMLGLVIAQLFVPESIMLNWAFYLALAFYGVIFGLSYLFKIKPRFIAGLSTLRTVAVSCLLISFGAVTIIFNAYVNRQDQRLYDIAQSYKDKVDPLARQLTVKLLYKLSEQFQTIQENELATQTPYLQGRLTETVEQIRRNTESAHDYSMDVHLIKNSGASVASYSTDLSSPGWVSIFNLQHLNSAVRIEQINKSTNRPIVHQPTQVRTNNKYKTFYRGWIPVFGNDGDDPLAWILCSVYLERLDFDRPINAVMASLTYDDLNKSYQILKYSDGELRNSTHQGVTTHFPTHINLKEFERRAMRRDTLVYYSSQGSERAYRSLLLKENNSQVLKVSAIAPDFRNILFSFFRFNFITLFAGSICVFLANITRLHSFTFLGKNERFQDRIADNFLVATLVFLTLLVVATHIAIRDQNENIVRQELYSKLRSLGQSLERSQNFQANHKIDSRFLLDSLASELNTDASFYAGRFVTTSTTPQIYEQHILPSALPYPIYEDLYVNNQRDVLNNFTLSNQDFLVGYRSVLSSGKQPVAAIAIPTFVRSPKYDKQLLETTSYLIILYFLVFGLFILGTALLSQQLTRPLHFIQEGLNKISKGNLDTTIPVTSKDEIGSLASAYNEMVFRLKELQDELAKAERESAWKEMAQQVAHEIKNPLTPMKLSIQHLERQLDSDQYSIEELKPKIKKITDSIIDQIQSLNAIASDFSKFSKPVDEEFRDVPINEVLCSVTDLYNHDENIEIQTQLGGDGMLVNGVADELQRVFINLIKNAYEAMPDGGVINLRSYSRGNSVFIEIEDNGHGIREKDKSKIFVPNFSTKSSGTGLGLAICKKIVEAHDGSISFASIEGKGTTFIVKLPLRN